MGSFDIKVKFGTDADPDRWVEANWTLVPSRFLNEEAAFIQYPGGTSGGFYKEELRNTPGGTWDFYVRVSGLPDRPEDVLYVIGFIKLSDGYYYVVGIKRGPGSNVQMGYYRTMTRPTATFDTLTVIAETFPVLDPDNIPGLRFYPNGDVDIIKGTFNAGDPWKPTFTVLEADIFTGVSVSKITEAGWMCNNSDTPGGNVTRGHLYYMVVEADQFILELGNAEIISIKALHAPAGQGYGTILISDPRLANYATILGNVKKLRSIRETTYGNSFILGEVESLNIIDKDTLSVSISNNAIKARKQKCNHNQLLYSNFLKYVKDDEIWDHGDAIPTGLTGYAVSMEKKNLNAMTLYPISLVEDHSPISGDIYSLYQDEEILNYGEDKTYSNDYTQFTFHLYITSKNDISKLKLNLKYKIRAQSGGYHTNPLWEVFQNGGWSTLYDVSDDETDGGDIDTIDISHLDVLPMDLFTITNLLETVDSLNTSGYVEYSLKIRFFSGQRAVFDNKFHRYLFDIIQLVVETEDVEQPVTVGQGLIDAASDVDSIIFDNVTPTWNIEKFPASEGFGEGDQYYVTKWLDDILVDIFASADTLFSYSQNITDIENQVIFTDDLTMEYLYNVLETVKNTLNAPWWLNAETNFILQWSIDNLLVTGLTLTNIDFVGGIAGISYVVDGKNIRTHATVIGKNDTVTSTIDEEYTPEGGNEEEIVLRPNISNPTALNEELETLIKKHTNANVAVSGTIDYSTLLQNNSSVSLFKIIMIKLQDYD